MKKIVFYNRTSCAIAVFVALAAFCSCYSYIQQTVKRPVQKSAEVDPFASIASSGKSIYDWKHAAGSKPLLTVRKYYVLMKKSGPISEMNNKGVALAADELYFEAEIIFRQALEETETEAALYNNLGVVCEMTGRLAEASHAYIRACLLDDENRFMRANFLGLHETAVK